MQKMIFGLIAIVLLSSNSFGQSNNPFNQFGADVVQASRVIAKDYQEGKLKDINQSTLDLYFKSLLAEYPRIKLDDFTQVLGKMKNATSKSIIEGSGYSEEGKAFLNRSLTNGSITALVEDVNKSKIDSDEKQNILKVLAINYNLIKPNAEKKSAGGSTTVKGPNANFDIYFDDSFNPFSGSEGVNTVILGGLGFIFGNAICGLGCGIAGGIIGLIVGGYLDSMGVQPHITPGNSGSSGSSGSSWHPQP